MARYVAQEKKGYYKIPPHLVPLIGTHLSCADPELTRILDPCAGEGEALELLGQNLGLNTNQLYANELDEVRAEVCKSRNLITLCGDAVMELKAPQFGFQILYLNPPYDDEGDAEGRTELKFLSLYRYLASNGVLIYVIPINILHKRNVMTKLVNEFHNIRVYRFPNSDYSSFKQCVLIAHRNRGDVELEKRNLFVDINQPPILGEDIQTWHVPTQNMILKEHEFYSCHLTQEKINQLMFSVNAKKECEFGLSQPVERQFQSLMPLRAGHQAVILATGLMDGAFRDPETDNILIVSGKTELKEVKSSEVDETNCDIIRIRKTPQPVVMAFDISASCKQNEIILYNMR